jgi:hypothetical protein
VQWHGGSVARAVTGSTCMQPLRLRPTLQLSKVHVEVRKYGLSVSPASCSGTNDCVSMGVIPGTGRKPPPLLQRTRAFQVGLWMDATQAFTMPFYTSPNTG